jgi:hypothetical protein
VRGGRRRSAGLTWGGRRGRGPHISEGEEGKAVWADQRPLGQLAGGPALGRGEVDRDWAENRRWAKVQKEILFEFQLIFFEFGRTLKNCTRDLGEILTWGFFLKSSRLLKDF